MSRLVPHALMVASLTVLAPGCESSGAPLDTGFDESDGSGTEDDAESESTGDSDTSASGDGDSGHGDSTETGDDLPPARN